jgi:hypothetical protein
MELKAPRSAERAERRLARLRTLDERVRRQIADAECLLASLEDYCRENPDDCDCAANDPGWREQLGRQRDDLKAMQSAVREKLKETGA